MAADQKRPKKSNSSSSSGTYFAPNWRPNNTNRSEITLKKKGITETHTNTRLSIISNSKPKSPPVFKFFFFQKLRNPNAHGWNVRDALWETLDLSVESSHDLGDVARQEFTHDAVVVVNI
jgi:hypothetical protein